VQSRVPRAGQSKTGPEERTSLPFLCSKVRVCTRSARVLSGIGAGKLIDGRERSGSQRTICGVGHCALLDLVLRVDGGGEGVKKRGRGSEGKGGRESEGEAVGVLVEKEKEEFAWLAVLSGAFWFCVHWERCRVGLGVGWWVWRPLWGRLLLRLAMCWTRTWRR